MIGWYFVVASNTRDDRINDADAQASILATWEVSVEGLDWIEELVGHGRASKLKGGGYPNLYTAKAGDVLPLLADGPPRVSRGMAIIGDDYVMPAGWQAEVQMHADRIAVCPVDQQLTIEAWDLS
jgi:hypothetical protein